MITYVDFSLFESPAKVLVNTVNTVGVMGKGIAREFKRIYPEMFVGYQRLCESGQMSIGDLLLYRTSHKWVLNFPTKKHWRNASRPEYVAAGLDKFVRMYQDAKITSVSFPLLGCGNGELDWKTQVKPLTEQRLGGLPIQVYIHIYPARMSSVPEHRDPGAIKQWLRSQPQSLAFTEMWEDLAAIVADNSAFNTLDDDERFNVELVSDGEIGIAVTTGDDRILMYQEQLRELWQQIRDLGLCIPQIMPGELDRHSRYILPVLARLPYLKPIRQAERDTQLTKKSVGLLLRARPQERVDNPPQPQQQLQLV